MIMIMIMLAAVLMLVLVGAEGGKKGEEVTSVGTEPNEQEEELEGALCFGMRHRHLS